MSVESPQADPAAGLKSINAPQSTREYLTSMWRRWEFALEVPREELRVAHQNTLLGNIWHLFNPILSVAVYYLIFGVIFQVNKGVDNFLIWLSIGIFAFQLTTSTVNRGANSITSNSGLIKAMRFPRALLPVSTTVSTMLTFVIELGVIAGMVILFTDIGVSGRWLMLPVVVAVHTALNLGLVFIAARLNDAFKDVQQIIPFLFRLLRYMSGVMFPVSRIVEAFSDQPVLAALVALNPIARILEMYRWVFLAAPYEFGSMWVTVAEAAVILWFGFRFFRAAEWRYGRA